MTSGSHCHKATAFMGGISGAPTGAQNARKLRFGVPRDPPGSAQKCQNFEKSDFLQVPPEHHTGPQKG